MNRACWKAWGIALMLTASVSAPAKGKKSPKDAEAASVGKPTILFEADPTSLVTTMSVIISSGAVDDVPGKAGATSMMAELLLRGTKKKSRDVFQSATERLGAAIGVRVSHDQIVFQCRVIKENTDKLLDLLFEALTQPAFAKKEFDSLKKENLAGISHRKNMNNRLAALAVQKELFGGTPLEVPIDGSLTSVAAIKLEDVKQRYADAFQRANFVFGFVSAINEAKLTPKIEAAWKKFGDGERRTTQPVTPKVPSKPTIVVVHKPKTSTGSVVFAQAGITAQDPARYALYVGNFSFGGEPLVSRLFKTIRGELGYTYAIGASYYGMGPLTHQPGVFVISSTPSVEFTTKTIQKTMSMWDEYLKDGVTGDELTLARESLVNSYPFEFESAEKRLSKRLYCQLYGVPCLSPEEFAKTIGGVDNKAVKKALAERQKAGGWVIAVVADKEVVKKQLEEEQKDVPEKDRLTIAKVIEPESLVR